MTGLLTNSDMMIAMQSGYCLIMDSGAEKQAILSCHSGFQNKRIN